MVETAMDFAVNHHYVIILALQIEAKKAGILFSVKKGANLSGRFSRTNFCPAEVSALFEFWHIQKGHRLKVVVCGFKYRQTVIGICKRQIV